MNPQEFAKCLDTLEQLVENSPGFMGKRMVNEEEFFVQIQLIRAKLNLNDAATKREIPSDKGSPWSNQA